jgi:chitin-binding protein
MLPVLTVVALLVSMFLAAPAQAHGYISSPPSRQAMCAQGRVANCGDIVYEPQSVEAPKGSMQCNGGGSRFAVLNDESKPWRATSVGTSVTFNWVLTARHRTSTWEYFVGSTRVAVVNDNGATPGATVTHTVSLAGYSGRIKVLARWNVYDTANAFYSCVDLTVGGGGGNPTPSASPTRSNPPSPSASPTRGEPPTGITTWTAGTAYAVGAVVTYNGVSYRCLQAHTALVGWEPPTTPALWQRL